MLDDIQIALPQGVRLSELRVVADFDKYDDCLQRAVVLLLIDPYNQFQVNGLSVAELIRRGNTATVSILNASLSALSGKLLEALNQDNPVASDVSMQASDTGGSKLELVINITKITGEQVSGNVRL